MKEETEFSDKDLFVIFLKSVDWNNISEDKLREILLIIISKDKKKDLTREIFNKNFEEFNKQMENFYKIGRKTDKERPKDPPPYMPGWPGRDTIIC